MLKPAAVAVLALGATGCGSYRPHGVFLGPRGLMTWSINRDEYHGFEFSRNHRAYLDGLG
ncbi:hypothetical protein ACQP1K_21265 [Sphaerimonospora sp. CA-214678]|uniref:hypothetical protein n=1 Tax=Sphaerimonospora sp. CA-214678 TaxID=3240029 RepID=UPI003D92A5D5